MLPTPEQVESYRRDGFLVVEEWLDGDEVERVRERFHRCFEHEWETGLAPDEVNYDPATTPPDRTRQLCNVWKADRTLAATVLAERNAAFGAALAGLPGLRLIQDNMIWKPPSGKALLCHQDAAYLEFLAPKNMTTCWMALDDTRADIGHDLLRARLEPLAARRPGRHVPRARGLARARPRLAARRARSSSSSRSRCPPAAPRSTTAGRSTAARRTSAPTPSAARSSRTWSRPPRPGATARRTRSTRATGARASGSSTRRSSPSSGARTAAAAPGWATG